MDASTIIQLTDQQSLALQEELTMAHQMNAHGEKGAVIAQIFQDPLGSVTARVRFIPNKYASMILDVLSIAEGEDAKS